MVKRILVPLLVLLLFVASVDRTTLLEWRKGIVHLNYNNQKFASGWFATKDGIIVGPHHLIKGTAVFVDHFPIIVTDHKKETYKAKTVGFYSDDIMFLRIEARLADPTRRKYEPFRYNPEYWFAEYEEPELYQECVAMGFPYGWRVALSAKIMDNMGLEILGIDRIPLEGASGSVILSEQGNYMAMLTNRFGYAQIVPGVLIKNALTRLKESRNEKRH